MKNKEGPAKEKSRRENGEHELISSPSLAALEEELIRQVRAEKEKDPLAPVVIVAGSALLGRYLQRLLGRALAGVINVRALTLGQTAAMLGRDWLEGEKGKTPLPSLTKELLLAEVMEKEKWEALAPLKEFDGFRRVLAAALRDLRDSGLTLSHYEKIIPDQGLPLKFRELAAAARRFFRSYAERYYDEADLFRAAAAQASLSPQRFRTHTLFLYGLYDFTFVQFEMIRAIARHLHLKVFIPFADLPAFDYARPGRQHLLSLGMKEKVVPPPLLSGSSLARLQSALAGGRTETAAAASADGTVEIIAARGERGEVEAIARRILSLAEEGIGFWEMGVVVHDPEEYLPLIREAFERAGIPFASFPAGPGFSPLRSAMKALIRLVPGAEGREFSRAEMMNLLLSPTVALPASRPGLTDDWRKWSIKAGIVAGKEQWDKKLAALAEKEKEPQCRGEIKQFRSFVLHLIAQLEEIPARGSFSQMFEPFARLLEKLMSAEVKPVLSEAMEELRASLAAADEFSLSGSRQEFKELLHEWARGLGEEEDSRRFQEKAVTVAGIMLGRCLRFRALFVPGLQNRRFPLPGRDEPVLLDPERETLMKHLQLAGWIPLKRRRPTEERLLFHLLAQAGSERLIFTYARTDRDGRRHHLPSHFLLPAAAAVTGRAISSYSQLEGETALVRRARDILLPGKRRLRQPPGENSEIHLDAAEFILSAAVQAGFKLPPGAEEVHSFVQRGLALFAARTQPSFNAFSGALTSPRSRAELKQFVKRHHFSARDFETYAKCPFAFLVERLLKLKSPGLPEKAEFGKMEIGSLIHELLARFFQRLKREGRLSVGEEEIPAVKEALGEEFEALCEKWGEEGKIAETAEWPLMKEELRERIEFLPEVLCQLTEERLRPEAFEISFGLGESSPGVKYSQPEPIPLNLPEGDTICLSGRIDRLDISPEAERFRCLDYKTGSKPFAQHDRFRDGTAVQPLIYLVAGAKLAGKEIDELGDDDSAGYAYVLEEDKKKLVAFSGRGYVAEGLNLLQTILNGIKSGLFPPLPRSKDEDFCDEYCLCAEICGPGRKTWADAVPEEDPGKNFRLRLEQFK